MEPMQIEILILHGVVKAPLRIPVMIHIVVQPHFRNQKRLLCEMFCSA
jgi:hypothetical protein